MPAMPAVPSGPQSCPVMPSENARQRIRLIWGLARIRRVPVGTLIALIFPKTLHQARRRQLQCIRASAPASGNPPSWSGSSNFQQASVIGPEAFKVAQSNIGNHPESLGSILGDVILTDVPFLDVVQFASVFPSGLKGRSRVSCFGRVLDVNSALAF